MRAVHFQGGQRASATAWVPSLAGVLLRAQRCVSRESRALSSSAPPCRTPDNQCVIEWCDGPGETVRCVYLQPGAGRPCPREFCSDVHANDSADAARAHTQGAARQRDSTRVDRDAECMEAQCVSVAGALSPACTCVVRGPWAVPRRGHAREKARTDKRINTHESAVGWRVGSYCQGRCSHTYFRPTSFMTPWRHGMRFTSSPVSAGG